jgi:hypothetical protein
MGGVAQAAHPGHILSEHSGCGYLCSSGVCRRASPVFFDFAVFNDPGLSGTRRFREFRGMRIHRIRTAVLWHGFQDSAAKRESVRHTITAMRKPDRVEVAFHRLNALRANPASEGAMKELRAFVAGGVNLIAAKAARIVGELQIAELAALAVYRNDPCVSGRLEAAVLHREAPSLTAWFHREFHPG